MLIKKNHEIFHWLLLRDRFKTVCGRLCRKLSRAVSRCPFLPTVIDRLFSVVQHLYWQCMLLKKCYIGYYKEEVFVYLFINNSMSSICQLNKMAHIAVALFEALRQEPSRMCVYIYMYCTATCSLHHPYGSVKSASKDWTVLGVKLFQRLELLRNLALGTVVSQTPQSSSVIATMPWHYSHHDNYISIPWLLSALVLVPQRKTTAENFLIACPYQGPSSKGSSLLLAAHSHGTSPAHVLVDMCACLSLGRGVMIRFSRWRLCCL